MNTIELSLEAFKKTVYQSVPFSLALKNLWKYKNIESSQRNEVSALVGCTLRHYLVFELRIKEFYPNPSQDVFSLCCLALSNIFFLKRIEQADFEKEASKIFTDEEFDVFKSFEKYFSESTHLIPDSINSNSIEFLSYRYNTPLWLVKMWNKHYGLNALYKILKANSHPNTVFVKSLTKEEIINENYEPLLNNNSVYKYVGKGPLKKDPLFESKNLFPVNLGSVDMLDKVDVDPIRGIAIYSGYSNTLLLDLVSRNSKYLRLDIVSPTFQSLYDNKSYIAKYGFENVKLYEAKASSLISVISSKVHTFFVMPNSSRFSMLRNTPDYFLRIDQNKLDELIAGQKESLEEASELTENNGYLIYCIDTISQKEGHAVIESFLEKHNNFSLIEEKQVLGFGSSSCLYYAIMLKGSNDD